MTRNVKADILLFNVGLMKYRRVAKKKKTTKSN